jgi:AcrR family transcriptional regulator
MSPASRPPAATRRTRGRPRDPGVEDAALGAARSLLIESGFAGCTIAAVAERAGVGKGTIYLRWPDKETLVAEAIRDAVTVDVPRPDTGSVRGDLLEILESLATGLRGDRGLLFAATVAELPRHPKLRALCDERVMAPLVAMIGEVIARGTRRREVRKVTDPALVADMLFAPLMICVLLWQQPIPKGMPTQIVDRVLDGLRPR